MWDSKIRGKDSKSALMLCEGIWLDDGMFEKKENRIWALFLKGILVYLICAGTIGSLLTAAGTPYEPFVLHFIILAASIGFSCMYYRKLTANIGGLLFLLLMVFFALQLDRYINSGFYAILNDLNDSAATYFNLNAVRVFTEQINNRRVAVTISMSFIGIILSMLLVILFMYRMRYACAAFLTLPFLLFPVYIGREPSLFYMGMLLLGLFGAFTWRRAGHYEKVDTDSMYGVDKKKNLRCIYHKKALLGFLGQIFVCILILLAAVSLIRPQKDYMEQQKISAWKLQTKDSVENFVMLGVSGFMNRYENVGGMNSGRLGGVSSVNLDYNTDLKLRITPYSYETVYLKHFTGGEYVPYENMWVRPAEGQDNNYEGDGLRHAYQIGEERSAEGKAEVEDVGNAFWNANLPYPYYSTKNRIIGDNNDVVQYTYYPRLAGNTTPVEQKIDRDYWLQIPDENYETIADFCEEADFKGSDREIIAQVKAYFQQEIPYTLRPGATPRKQDFINYFLEKNRKGYCAYFASAATLIFRYNGIPARYVEGYAVSYDEILDGTLVDGAEYADYYRGYSELGRTALVEVEATDADAHAWVEVYDENDGWVPVEVTPYSTEEERQSVDFWSMFLNFFGADEERAEQTSDEDNNGPATFVFTPNRKVIWAIVICFIAAAVIVPLVRQMFWWIRYNRSSVNDRLILRYQRFLHRKMRKYRLLSEKKNYREQIAYLTDGETLSETEIEQIIAVLEKAGFSNHVITSEEEKLLHDKLFFRKKEKEFQRKMQRT